MSNLSITRLQGPAGVQQSGHREYVGGLWETLGKLQFDFLVQAGLQPQHYLLDIACGSLRAGVHFIPYLEPGHYLGIEKEALLVQAGLEQELGPRLQAERQPQIVISDQFEFERFQVQPDFALAQSLFTHLPPSLIELCLTRLRPVLRPGGSFYATFFEVESPVANPAEPDDHGWFAYTRAEIESFGARNGWEVDYIGDWGHPRQQVMVRYHLSHAEAANLTTSVAGHTLRTPAPQPVVVVLGMHRSGTSLLAHVAHTLGVSLGRRLVPADEHNRDGYWEHSDIVHLQKQILEKLDRRWVGPKGTLPYPAEWWRTPAFQPLVAELTQIVAAEVNAAAGLWGFKDPRTARLLPMWKDIFFTLGLEPVYLLAIRQPQATVTSETQRDGTPANRSQLLWLEHNLEVVRETRGALGLVVDYDAWFSDLPHQARAVAAAVGAPWPADDSVLLAALSDLVRPDLRHHQPDSDFAYLPLVERAYALLREAASTGHIPGELFDIEARLREAQTLLGSWADVIDQEVVDATPRDWEPRPTTPAITSTQNAWPAITTGYPVSLDFRPTAPARPGWLRVNADPATQPDLVGRPDSLPMFPNSVVARIEAGAGLESLSDAEARCTLGEWGRVLVPGGDLALDLVSATSLGRSALRARLTEHGFEGIRLQPVALASQASHALRVLAYKADGTTTPPAPAAARVILEGRYASGLEPTHSAQDGRGVSRGAGEALYRLVRERQPMQTVETGFAHGFSTLFILQGLADNGHGQHVAFDPYAHTLWAGAGLTDVELAGLTGLLTLVELPSQAALPQLLAHGFGVDLALLDGSRLFDDLLVDWYYLSRMLSPEGLIVFGGGDLPALQAVLRLVAVQPGFRPAPLPEADGLHAFIKTGPGALLADEVRRATKSPNGRPA